MSRETQRKGDLAKSIAIYYFTSRQYEVASLLTESAPYDLIVDDGELHRVQVKYSSKWSVDMRRIHSNSTGYVVKQYEAKDFDWLFIYNPNEGLFLVKDAAGKQYVSYSLNDHLGAVAESGLLQHS